MNQRKEPSGRLQGKELVHCQRYLGLVGHAGGNMYTRYQYVCALN